MNYSTEQEKFWAGRFGSEYLKRDRAENVVTANTVLFADILKSAPGIKSVMEFGCSLGLNLRALEQINSQFDLHGYEINDDAVSAAKTFTKAKITAGSIVEKMPSEKKFDLTFTKGVLIHINPESLPQVYENLVNLSNRYVLVCEYYSPSPVTIDYRGNSDKLFKRDFAGELIDKYNLTLIDYGFCYRRDNYFRQDDTTWFLLQK